MVLQRTRQCTRTSRLVYGSRNNRNIYRAIQISIARPITMTTLKRLAATIRLALYRMDVQTVMARLASVCRVYQYQFHAKLNALISQELPQLVEAPRVTSTSLYLGSRQFIRPFPNSCQVF
jgi:hypothetical protein